MRKAGTQEPQTASVFLICNSLLAQLARCYLAVLPSILEIPFETQSLTLTPSLLPRSFTFYLGNPLRNSVATLTPSLLPRSFTFYLGNPFPRFLDSSIPAFLIDESQSAKICAICG